MPIILPSRYQNAATRTADMTQDMIDLSNVVTQINAGQSPITDVIFEAHNATSSIPVPSTPTVLTFPTVVAAQNIAFDSGTGIVTVQKTGVYGVVFMINAFPTVITSYFYGLEVDTGSGFVAVPSSGRQQAQNININGQIQFVSQSFLTAGLRARVYVWASNGTATFQTTNLTALPGGSLFVPATRVLITGV